MYQKYPRTFHLPWSPGVSSDDKIMRSLDNFIGRQVVITEKMDGENTTMYADRVYARSVDSRGGVDRDWVKRHWAEKAAHIPNGWRICGENLFAKHSIFYDSLPSFFLGFSIWDDRNICLSWQETLEYFALLSITPVPTIWEGVWDEHVIRNIELSLTYGREIEGYVVRLADSFVFDEFPNSVAKYVRANHVQTDQHWRHSELVPNEVAREAN